MKLITYICFCIILFACGDPTPVPVPIENHDTTGSFNYILSCSEDLLKFVTPIAIYYEENNIEHIDTLNGDVWVKSDSISLDGRLSVTVKGTEAFWWRKKISFTHFNVSTKMIVKYMEIENVSISDNKTYLFHHNLTCPVIGYTVDSDVISFTSGKPVSGSQVANYLQNLSRESDSREVSIDADGKISRW